LFGVASGVANEEEISYMGIKNLRGYQ